MDRCSHYSECLERASLSVRLATHQYANGKCEYHDVAWKIIEARKAIDEILDNRCECGNRTPPT